jgi:protein-tyrosine phosphatase
MSLILSSIKHDILKDIKTVYEYMSKPSDYDNYNFIIDGLYLGNYDAACSKTFILSKEIDFVVNCSNNLEWPEFYKSFERPNFRYLRIPLDDSFNQIDQEIMASSLKSICPTIYDIINNKNINVFVHCYAGAQRSATVVLCYLIYKDYIENKKILSLKEYYKFLKNKRSIVFHPDPTFVNVIYRYHKNTKKLIDNSIQLNAKQI